MSNNVKRDNRSLFSKQELRRKLLREMNLEPLRILDLCAGEGHVWRKLREEFIVESYTPVDHQPKQLTQLRLKIDARTIEGFNLERYNVIDVDTYGEPWTIWHSIYPRITHSTGVFLTRGRGLGELGNISKTSKRSIGIPVDWNIPRGQGLSGFIDRYALLQCRSIETAYVINLGEVQYYALAVKPTGETNDRPI